MKIEHNLTKSKIRICVVIATKDRPEMLHKLLESIEVNQLKPDLISIVSSGGDIKNVITKFNKTLKIVHRHTIESGQVLQRNIALKNTIDPYEAYVFLDDDITVDHKLFFKIAESFSQNDKNLGGYGLNMETIDKIIEKDKSRDKNIYDFTYQYLAGRVLKSGRNINYLKSRKVKQVMWLNGLSIWTYPVISRFNHVQMGNKYAAAEDLIFSYEVGKNYNLYYRPELRVYEQCQENREIPNLNNYRTSWQHKLYFILKNKELSFWLYILDEIFSIVALLLSLVKGKLKIKLKITYYHIRFIRYVLINRKIFLYDQNYQNRLINQLI